MIGDEFLADLLDNIIGAPVLAIEEHNTFHLTLCTVAAVLHHLLIHAVTDLRVVVVAAVAKRQLIKGSNRLAFDIQRFAVKEIIVEFRRAVIAARIEVKALLCIGTRIRTVDADACIRRINSLSGIKQRKLCGALPLSAALRVIGGLLAKAHHREAALAAGILSGLAEHIDALFFIKQVIRIGDERNHAHLSFQILSGIADKVGVCRNLTHIPLLIDRNRTHDHGLFDRIGRRRIRSTDIGSGRVYIRLIRDIAYRNRAAVPLRITVRSRIAAVQCIIDGAAGSSRERQRELRRIESALLGENRRLNDNSVHRAGRIALSRRELVQHREILAAVRNAAECKVVIQRRNFYLFENISVCIRQQKRLTALGKTEGRTLNPRFLRNAAVDDTVALCTDRSAGRNHISLRIFGIIGKIEPADGNG